jgi:hypothetical protein
MSSGFFSLLVLVAIHLFANRAKVFGWVWHGKFLSFASGISFAYIFVDLLPALEKGAPVLKRTLEQIIPYLDKHCYLIALAGILFYYGVQVHWPMKKNRWLPISGYLLFNSLIGMSLSDSANPEIQPLALYTIAIGMHYFIQDHLTGISLHRSILTTLILALFAGYFVGYFCKIPDYVTAIGISFAAGGIILNVLHYELPKRKNDDYVWFVFGSLLYTSLLLSLGNVKVQG